MSRATYEITTGGVTRTVQIEALGLGIAGKGTQYRVSIDGGAPILIDAQRPDQGQLSLLLRDRSYEAGLVPTEEGFDVDVIGTTHEVAVVDPRRRPVNAAGAEGAAVLRSQMPGRVTRVLVAVGAQVAKGEPLMVIEAMKMENEIKAPRAGRVVKLAVKAGDLVEARAVLAEVESA
jgi:biotin carboxyl carrier protein